MTALRIGLVVALFSVAAAAEPDRPARWEWRFDAGGEANRDPHGVVDLQYRKGPWNLSLYTDTLDARYAPERAKGRFWIGARVEALAAGLLLSPWTDGAPDLSRALLASYAGLDAGAVRYFPWLYAGVQASARIYLFQRRGDATTIEVPGPTPLITAELFAGRWTQDGQIAARAGFDLQSRSFQPHVSVEVIYRPRASPGRARILPRLELRAAWARDQTFLTRTRLGGLNPYVVPLAGAAWAEWWVESYVAGRAGASFQHRRFEIGLLADAAAFDGRIVAGFALLARVPIGRWFVESTLGWAPYLPRPPGSPALSAFLLVGIDWSPLGKR